VARRWLAAWGIDAQEARERAREFSADRARGLSAGAMGLGAERHNVRLFLPDGAELCPELLRSRDGLVKVIAGREHAWLGEDGFLYESPADMQAADPAADPAAGPDGGVQWVVPETIGARWQVLAGPGRRERGAVLARIRDVDRRWDLAPATWLAGPEHSLRLADLFPDCDYEISPGFGDVRVARFTDLFAGAPLCLRLSVGVRLGGGVLAALEELVRGLDPVVDDAEALRVAMWFGWRVARRYLACAPDWDVVGAVTVAEVMTLAFAQLSAVLDCQARRQEVMRNWTAVVARHSLSEIWAELGPRLQAFFAGQADGIRELFEAEFGDRRPDFAARYNSRHGRPEGARVDLRDVVFFSEYARAPIAILGRLSDEFLRPAPGGRRTGPEVFDIGRADSGGPDRSRGSGPGVPLPLVVLELRYTRPSKDHGRVRPGMHRVIDFPMMADLIERMTGVARRGEAAAEFARRLPGSPQGQSVMTGLRELAAAPRGAERDRAAQDLRRAAGQYLEKFPGQSAALNMTLGPFTEQ
jgi:hypothetical protein